MTSVNSLVLAVEEPANLSKLKNAILASDPIHIVTATDGGPGQQPVEELVSDLVLPDLVLAEVGGFEILDSIPDQLRHGWNAGGNHQRP